ncbi:GNAT family N-acetyltransferase [Gemelliphila palaticanis]|uniref:GNAT family N-acetyltransferase n=1 Tax=Gemelliphila palaticanis TaxID=81950 RepID=A0ABX2SXZ7_9BACL|nr:GNAT family N-acetyltransferase [Gemella palaticanis]MBF0715099.1 GNAT family N-acetyltransferase [Gemella palaticanis]NYS47029.1 GNAT family N-acetyltransferase [Gemella palaticanis]
MQIKLLQIDISEAENLWEMQIAAFKDLLNKYQDFDTSPGNESIDRIKNKLLQKHTYFYYVYKFDEIVGAIRVVDNKDETRKRIAPIFIIKKFRNQGIAQRVFKEIEKIHGSDNWQLDTIYEEKGNCYLYEKLGYKKTGEIEKINDKMSIVYYIKD